jgi:phthiocerol/phenolphthiocerol synthesis type-I polyketide synthase E
VADIWADILQVRELDRRDSFLLGGDSLMAGRAVGRVNATFGIELSIQQLFDAPTLEGFSATVAAELANHVDAMTDDEVEALLEELQAELSVGERTSEEDERG